MVLTRSALISRFAAVFALQDSFRKSIHFCQGHMQFGWFCTDARMVDPVFRSADTQHPYSKGSVVATLRPAWSGRVYYGGTSPYVLCHARSGR